MPFKAWCIHVDFGAFCHQFIWLRNTALPTATNARGLCCTLFCGDYDISFHYSDVMMSAMASEITGVSIIRSTVGSGADQRKHQSTASLFLFDDVIMLRNCVVELHIPCRTGLLTLCQGPLLLTWFNLNPSMDK